MALDEGNEYARISGSTGTDTALPIAEFYTSGFAEWNPPKPTKYKDAAGKDQESKGNKRNALPSIFNRYSVFYFNSSQSGNPADPETYMDGVNFADLGQPPPPGETGGTGGRSVHNRRNLDYSLLKVEREPTASNIIRWVKEGKSNALEYAWEDFLWCKNYGMIPNNYMITMRRFPMPVMDDLMDSLKNPSPDIGRLITWVDGEVNTWESAGLKWSHNLVWKELESEVQVVAAPDKAGNEGDALGGIAGNIIKALSFATQPGAEKAATGNPNAATFDPYQNSNAIWGPIDVIKKMMIRDKGLEFAQSFTLTFNYELRSIDGVNPKVAMIDLLSNIMVCTMNRGNFWGGDVRFTGGNPRNIKPIGNTEMLAKGNYGGYISSLVGGLMGRFDKLTGGAGFSLEGAGNALKTLGSGAIANIVGGGLDKAGRPGVAAVNSLLTGEDTGEWHVMVGNPANPIISVGNLVLEKTDIQFGGSLGPDDFPTKLTVVCTLKSARPRDRTDIMAMFHRNTRTYLTNPPSVTKYAGNVPKGGKNGGKITSGAGADFRAAFNPNNVKTGLGEEILRLRFPNHSNKSAVITESAKGIF
jgi:hypothetical protein